MEIGGVNVLVAFLAGLVSCISPCVLPLAPIYVSSLVGGSVGGAAAMSRQAPLVHAVMFMTGFILLFTALGVSVGLVGFLLQDHLRLLERVGGIFLIAMGLHMAGVIRVSAFYRGVGVDWDQRVQNGYLRSFLSGMFISAGWLPCVGPTLGAILTLAVTSGTALQGGMLLLVYSLGLAVPFISLGIALSHTPAALRWINRHHAITGAAAGLIMVVMGILLFTGMLTRLNQYFGLASSGLGAEI
ncbi:MAG: cytochrome c biogenesis CcdA family protein [Dehalococcoidia bacterium]